MGFTPDRSVFHTKKILSLPQLAMAPDLRQPTPLLNHNRWLDHASNLSSNSHSPSHSDVGSLQVISRSSLQSKK